MEWNRRPVIRCWSEECTSRRDHLRTIRSREKTSVGRMNGFEDCLLKVSLSNGCSFALMFGIDTESSLSGVVVPPNTNMDDWARITEAPVL